MNYDEAEELIKKLQQLIEFHNNSIDRPKLFNENILGVVIVPINATYDRVLEIYKQVHNGVDNKSLFKDLHIVFDIKLIVGQKEYEKVSTLEIARKAYPLYALNLNQ